MARAGPGNAADAPLASSPVNFGRRLPATALATVVVGVLGLSACGTSTPSNRRMAEDIVETVDGLTDQERECMREKLEGYTGDELEAINAENENVDWDAEGATGGEKWQAFVADLDSCRDIVDEASDGSDASEGSEAESTEAGDSDSTDDVPVVVEAVTSTEPTATTEPGSR